MSSNLAASVGSLRIKDPDGLSAYDSSESLSELETVNRPPTRSHASANSLNGDAGDTKEAVLDTKNSRAALFHLDDESIMSKAPPGPSMHHEELRSPTDTSRSRSHSVQSHASSRLTADDRNSEDLAEHHSDDYNEKSIEQEVSLEQAPSDSVRLVGTNQYSKPDTHSASQKPRVRSTGSPSGSPSGADHSSNSLGFPNLEYKDAPSPLDDVDRLLSGSKPLGSPNSRGTKAVDRGRSPLSSGLLSFNGRHDASSPTEEDEYDEGEHYTPNGAGDGTIGGVRRKLVHTRKLETEIMELRLRLQQYREINASEQEISRVKYQLSRSEKRIDELEEALERKNQTIRDLVAQREANIQIAQSDQTKELYQTIEELQSAISALEQETMESNKQVSGALSQAHTEFPDVVPSNAAVSDLIDALRASLEENERLKSLAATASSLRSQQASLKDLLTSLGYPGDPQISVREVVGKLNEAIEDAAAIREALGRENWKMSRDLESLREAYHLKSKEATESNTRLKLLADKDTATVRDLEDKLEDLEHVLNESRSTSYTIVRRFFAELFEVLGTDFQDVVEEQLEEIMTRAKAEGLSKIPLLTELLVSHTRRLAELVLKPASKPQDDQKVWALEREVQSLEQIIGMKWDKLGADAVLRAQVKDLRNQLKLEQEKRKSEWMEYQRSLQKARGLDP